MTGYTLVLLILALFLVPYTHAICNPILPPQHGKINYHPSYSYYQVSCDAGYILHGNPLVLCSTNGEWSNPPPKCIEIESNACELLPAPENGIKECEEEPLSIGKSCKFSCSEGYDRTGSETRICLPELKWSGLTTRCILKRNANVDGHRSEMRSNYYKGFRLNDQSTSRDLGNNPCTNFGCKHICKSIRGMAKCRCRDGYILDTDNKNCIETSQSDSNSYNAEPKHPCDNHQCEQICRVEKGKAQCRCYKGFLLNKEDQKSCLKNYGPPVHNPCKFNNGGCEHVCNPLQVGNICSCNPGYSLAADGKKCHNEQIIYDRPALNTRSCRNNKGECDHNCHYSQRGQITCSCHLGYTLATDGKKCIENVSSGHLSNPCLYNNGGCEHECQMLNGQMQCSCNAGYALSTDGRRCVENVSPGHLSNPCLYNNGGCEHECQMLHGQMQCSCNAGYALSSDGKRCVDINECLQNNGGCEHRCTNTRGSYFCRCHQGYHLNNILKKCVDIDECKNERLNRCEHICENTEGSYICRCQPGYLLIEEHKCEGCRKGSFWSTEENGCIDCPSNSFTQSEGKTTKDDCVCFTGFTGSPADNIPCTDIDECANDNFGCSHECVNTPGEAFCNCPFGYTLDRDNKTCIDIDECSIKNGGCEGHCFNTDGSFYCTCPTGYRKSNKNIYSCEDIDECLENNGDCQHVCNNYRGGYYCGCKEGYRLDSSLKNCTDVSCPNVPLPHFSTKKCKKDKVQLFEMDNYPTGTVCTFKCASGFKEASGSNVMECLEDGTWQGNLASCKSQHCPPLPVPEHGNVHPSSCSTDGNTVKQKCTFTCQRGYKLKGGTAVFNCKNDLTWKENITSIPVCEPEEIRASIECVRDIKATLQPGKSSHNITIPIPVTNMESYEIKPDNIVVGKPMEFQAGITKVLFSTSSPSSSRIAKCMTSIHVIDEEPPVFISCPEDIFIENAKVDGEFVTWDEPEVTDNVEVESLKSSVEPNTTITPGSYLVEYVASDSAGNTDTCTFKIDIIRMKCDNLTDPINGEASCMDLLYGKLCQPLCKDGYMRNPSDPVFYSCGDSGIWEPSDVISDCLPFSDAVSSTCPEGSELMILEDTDEEICLECSSKAVWSPTTRKCEAKMN